MPDLAAVETRDNGSLLRSMRDSVMPRVARNFRSFADRSARARRLGRRRDQRARGADHAGTARASTAVITPWNAPLMLATWRVAPALAAGNTVVLEAPRMGAAHGIAARRHRARGGAARRGRSTSSRGSARRPAPRWSPTRASHGSRSPGRSRPAGSSRRRPARTSRRSRSSSAGSRRSSIFADADLDAVVRAGGEPVRQRRPGVPGGDPAARRGARSTRTFVERLVGGRRRDRAGRPARGRDRHRAADHARALRTGRRVRPAREATRAPASLFGGGPNEDLGGLYYRPTLFADAPDGSRDPHARRSSARC